MINLQECYILEDMFPKSFTDYEERPYGILLYNVNNKDSFDSNHAVIFRDKIDDFQKVLEDIDLFYSAKRINPTIYQSTLAGRGTSRKNIL